ncbi:MAG: zinc transporter ZupT [Cyanobacteriota bacterium]|nr:zinc transporter ZupT [Cyanobacteriota bacterium]
MPGLSQHVAFALLLTLAAGLSTGIGSLLGLLNQRFSPRILALSLSFSAGVMIQVSFVEIFPKARSALSSALGARAGYGWTVAAFFAGIAVMAALDQLLPNHTMVMPPSDGGGADERQQQQARTLMRMGLFSALAIAIHNFPEGLATFVAALDNPRLGIGIALAIAIHNIPEGLAISAPIHYATGNRAQAFWLSFASGLAEPLGALLGYWLLLPVMGPLVLGLIFASVGGVMVYICLDELLPAAQRYGTHHQMIAGVIAGMLVMSLSLVLLA